MTSFFYIKILIDIVKTEDFFKKKNAFYILIKIIFLLKK